MCTDDILWSRSYIGRCVQMITLIEVTHQRKCTDDILWWRPYIGGCVQMAYFDRGHTSKDVYRRYLLIIISLTSSSQVASSLIPRDTVRWFEAGRECLVRSSCRIGYLILPGARERRRSDLILAASLLSDPTNHRKYKHSYVPYNITSRAVAYLLATQYYN